ncbi:cell division ATP-binding protein FtsE [Porticoccus sp.]|jgi:cell division transport system ATP-binding protein|nr:cell division ATP-binding protein FtsE [Cellvibrionales bacterium]MCH9797625.1 cell division ATP-binding protein FtsE [Gammaproteobacteria bacterium]MDA7737211.1 cell division ATP-binding protein FtsE [Porticoccus sp.]MBT7437862.1 cell division ATP-binding protein FtsE [Cellvibrionales bacterium]MCH9843077.1 cell division ATP-binding protein FtsE [Gammaproteobacteria bacterium]
MILFDKVNKRYPSGHQAIINLSFELEAGEMAFLTGHSGAGKSTLLKLIMLLERSTSGQLLIDGKNLSRIDRTQIPYYRRNIGVVFQNHQLLFDRNIFDNVALPLFVSGLRPRDVGRRVRAALDKVGLSGKEKMNPIMLSGGEQQRLGIARAVVHKPKILLADEPTGNLDPQLSEEIMGVFNKFCEAGSTVLVASHDLELVSSIAQRLLRLEKGFLVEDKKTV